MATTSTRNVDDDVDAGTDEGMHRVTVEPCGQPERLEPRGDVRRGVRVDRAASALVPGVQGGEEIDDLGSAYLADDDAIRAHAQRLPHEIANRDDTRALDIRDPCLQRDGMRVVRGELGGVLDDDESLRRVHVAEEGTEHRGLPRAGAAAHDEGQARGDDRPQPGGASLGDGPGCDEIGDGEGAPARDAQGDEGAGDRDRRDDRVQAGAVRESTIDIGGGVVEAPTDAGGEALREATHVVIGGERHA